jgi:hypothetical protein
MCYVAYVFALVALICCWAIADVSVRAKLILTGIYAATWLADLVIPFAGGFLQMIFALGVYALTFRTGKGSPWRP